MNAVTTSKVEVEHVDLVIEGMTCASCVRRVEKALAAVRGVLGASVNLATERASVEAAAGTMRPSDLVAAVRRAGYGGAVLTGDLDGDRQSAMADDRRLAREPGRVVAAILLSLPLLLPMVGLTLPGWLQLV